MNVKAVDKLLVMISEIVREDGSWTEKRDAILAEASDEDKTNLYEFAGWFEEEVEDRITVLPKMDR